MAYAFGGRLDDDSYAITYVDEDQGTAVTKGEINGVPFEGGGGGGSSDFSTAMMTVIGDDVPIIFMCTIYDMPEDDFVGSFPSNTDLSSPYPVILYKGKAYLNVTGNITSISGNASIDEESELLVVTGDCTITIS